MQHLLTTLPLLARGEAPGLGIWLAAIGFTAVCIIMMLVVLIQKPKGGGLSGAFGGGAGGGSSQAFVGGGIGNVLTFVTVALFIMFLLLAGGMTLAINAGDPVPEEEDAEQVEEGAGSPEAGSTETPAPEPKPEPETEPETEPVDEEPADEPSDEAAGDDAPAAEGESEDTPAESDETPAEGTEPTE